MVVHTRVESKCAYCGRYLYMKINSKAMVRVDQVRSQSNRQLVILYILSHKKYQKHQIRG